MAKDHLQTSDMQSDAGEDPADDQEPSICNLAVLCYKSLERFLEATSNEQSPQLHQRILLLFRPLSWRKSTLTLSDLRDGFEQFRVWTRNIGVFATDNLSLDFRLREATEVKDGNLSLLRSMLLDLEECEFLVRNDRPPTSEEDSSDSDNSDDEGADSSVQLPPETKSAAVELQARLRNISDAIDKLVELAEVIRSSSVRSRNLRAQNFELWEDGFNVLEAFEEIYLPRILALKFHLEEPLLTRFCKALCLRRRRFLYQAQHQKRLAYGTDEPERSQNASFATQSRTRANAPVGRSPGGPDPAVLGREGTTTQSEVAGNRRSQATKFNLSQFPKVRSMIVPSSLHSSTQLVDVPLPPLLPFPGASHFECPYCCILVPRAKQARGLWKKHVIDDLKPFICIEPQCRNSDSLFETRDDWVDHQRYEHAMQWWCPGGEGHSTMRFDTEEDFANHLRQSHKIYSTVEVEKRTRMAGHPSTSPFSCCPFCDFQTPIQRVLQNHILAEMFRIFLVALPDRDDVVDEDVNSNTHESVESRSTLRDTHIKTTTHLSFDPEPNRLLEISYGKPEPELIEKLWETVWTSPQLQRCVRETYNADEDTVLKSFQTAAHSRPRKRATPTGRRRVPRRYAVSQGSVVKWNLLGEPV